MYISITSHGRTRPLINSIKQIKRWIGWRLVIGPKLSGLQEKTLDLVSFPCMPWCPVTNSSKFLHAKKYKLWKKQQYQIQCRIPLQRIYMLNGINLFSPGGLSQAAPDGSCRARCTSFQPATLTKKSTQELNTANNSLRFHTWNHMVSYAIFMPLPFIQFQAGIYLA